MPNTYTYIYMQVNIAVNMQVYMQVNIQVNIQVYMQVNIQVNIQVYMQKIQVYMQKKVNQNKSSVHHIKTCKVSKHGCKHALHQHTMQNSHSKYQAKVQWL